MKKRINLWTSASAIKKVNAQHFWEKISHTVGGTENYFFSEERGFKCLRCNKEYFLWEKMFSLKQHMQICLKENKQNSFEAKFTQLHLSNQSFLLNNSLEKTNLNDKVSEQVSFNLHVSNSLPESLSSFISSNELINGTDNLIAHSSLLQMEANSPNESLLQINKSQKRLQELSNLEEQFTKNKRLSKYEEGCFIDGFNKKTQKNMKTNEEGSTFEPELIPTPKFSFDAGVNEKNTSERGTFKAEFVRNLNFIRKDSEFQNDPKPKNSEGHGGDFKDESDKKKQTTPPSNEQEGDANEADINEKRPQQPQMQSSQETLEGNNYKFLKTNKKRKICILNGHLATKEKIIRNKKQFTKNKRIKKGEESGFIDGFNKKTHKKIKKNEEGKNKNNRLEGASDENKKINKKEIERNEVDISPFEIDFNDKFDDVGGKQCKYETGINHNPNPTMLSTFEAEFDCNLNFIRKNSDFQNDLGISDEDQGLNPNRKNSEGPNINRKDLINKHGVPNPSKKYSNKILNKVVLNFREIEVQTAIEEYERNFDNFESFRGSLNLFDNFGFFEEGILQSVVTCRIISLFDFKCIYIFLLNTNKKYGRKYFASEIFLLLKRYGKTSKILTWAENQEYCINFYRNNNFTLQKAFGFILQPIPILCAGHGSVFMMCGFDPKEKTLLKSKLLKSKLNLNMEDLHPSLKWEKYKSNFLFPCIDLPTPKKVSPTKSDISKVSSVKSSDKLQIIQNINQNLFFINGCSLELLESIFNNHKTDVYKRLKCFKENPIDPEKFQRFLQENTQNEMINMRNHQQHLEIKLSEIKENMDELKVKWQPQTKSENQQREEAHDLFIHTENNPEQTKKDDNSLQEIMASKTKNSTKNKKIQKLNKGRPEYKKIKYLKNDSFKKEVLSFEEIKLIFLKKNRSFEISFLLLLFICCARVNEVLLMKQENLIRKDCLSWILVPSSKDSNKKKFLIKSEMIPTFELIIQKNMEFFQTIEEFDEKLQKQKIEKRINTWTKKMNRLLKKLIKRHVSTHSLRYTILHLSYGFQKDVMRTMELAGHKELKTTQHYLSTAGSPEKLSLYSNIQLNPKDVLNTLRQIGLEESLLTYFFN